MSGGVIREVSTSDTEIVAASVTPASAPTRYQWMIRELPNGVYENIAGATSEGAPEIRIRGKKQITTYNVKRVAYTQIANYNFDLDVVDFALSDQAITQTPGLNLDVAGFTVSVQDVVFSRPDAYLLDAAVASFTLSVKDVSLDTSPTDAPVLVGTPTATYNAGMVDFEWVTDIDSDSYADVSVDGGISYVHTFGEDTLTTIHRLSFTAIDDYVDGGSYHWCPHSRSATGGNMAAVDYFFASGVVAPTLTSPTAIAVTTSTATPRVTTNQGNGTVYMAIVTDGLTRTNAQIIAGTGCVAFEGMTVSMTGAQTFTPVVAGLSAGSYDILFFHRNLGLLDSAQVKYDLTIPASGVVLDSASSIKLATGVGPGDTPTWTHTPVGTPSGVFVMVDMYADPDNNAITGIDYGGDPLTQVVTVIDSAWLRCSIWASTHTPPSGAQTVTITHTDPYGGSWLGAMSVAVTGSNATDQVRGSVHASGEDFSPDAGVLTSAVGDLVLGIVGQWPSSPVFTALGGQTIIAQGTDTGIGRAFMQIAGAATVDLTLDSTQSARWRACTVSIRPA